MVSLDLHEFRRHTAEDQDYQVLKKTILSSFPNQKASLKEPVKKFGASKTVLASTTMWLYTAVASTSPIVSEQQCSVNSTKLTGQGISLSQARACLSIYWPGIDGDIDNFVKGCGHCQDHLPLILLKTSHFKSSTTKTIPADSSWLVQDSLPAHWCSFVQELSEEADRKIKLLMKI